MQKNKKNYQPQERRNQRAYRLTDGNAFENQNKTESEFAKKKITKNDTNGEYYMVGYEA